MSARGADGDTAAPGIAYELVASGWRRQTHAFAQSVRLYTALAQQRHRQRAGALSVPAVDPLPGMAGGAPPRLSQQEQRPDPAPASALGHALTVAEHRRLTGRQLEIAGLIARGLTNAQIAQVLVLTPGTVGNHVAHILRRLGANNRAQVAAWTIRQTSRADEAV